MSERARTATVAVLAVLAVSFAAATLDSTVAPERGGGGGGSGAGGSVGGGGAPSAGAPPPGETLGVPFPPELFAALAAVVVLAALAYTYRYRRETFVVLVGVLVAVGAFSVLFSHLSAPGPQIESAAVENTSGGGIDLGSGGARDGPAPSPISLPLVGALLVALVAAGVAVTRRRRGDTGRAAAAATDDADGEADAAAVGRAAGRAADRIEDETSDENEVYRAWREMTALLDVATPETSTPGEFADAAVAAGLDREDVTELTRLFEDVRYGDRDPGAASERRAVAVFRRIEREYAEDEP